MSGFRPGVRLGVDWGQARIGVAACDPGGTLAFPVTAVAAGPLALTSLRSLIEEYRPIEIVAGLPRTLAGREGLAAATVRAQLAELAVAVAPLQVRLVDERLTTVAASRRLRESGRNAKRQRQRIDAAAAVGILTQALEIERNLGRPPGELLSTDSGIPNAADVREETA